MLIGAISMTIYLYKKTHNITGLKYLGKTTQNPFKYKGSGKRWVPHIKKHGYDVTTEILKECSTKEEVAYWGRYYSELWNVVTEVDDCGRKTWANLKPEEGDGGLTVFGNNHPMKNPKNVEKVRVAWTEEKRKENSKTNIERMKNRPYEEQLKINQKLKESWDRDLKRKAVLRNRMMSDNPSKKLEVIEKIADTKATWSTEKRKQILAKTTGERHYRNDPNYVSTQIGKTHPRYDTTLRTFKNTYTNEEVTLSVFDFINKYNLHQGNVSLVVNDKRKSVLGWILIN
jgi:hypothetical protein